MNYFVQYLKLMKKAATRGWVKKTAPEYIEMHHVVPNSWVKNKWTVGLTAKEHFTAHRWLHKAFPDDNKMAHAYWQMCMRSKSGHLPFKSISKQYEEGKMAHSKASSGDNNPSKRPEVRAKMSESNKGNVSWNKGLTQETSSILKSISEKNSVNRFGSENPNYQNRYKMTNDQCENVRNGREGFLNSEEGVEYRSKMSGTQRRVAERLREEGFTRTLNLVECPHCGKEGKGGNMSRYHFDNCKHKRSSVN